jgi:hypothetical protein
MLHGTTLDNIEAIDQLIYRAARQLLLDIDPQETIRISQFTNPIYSEVYDYALPADLKGNGIIDIRPQVNRSSSDVYGAIYSQDFDTSKKNGGESFNINFNSGIKTIRLNAPSIKQGVTLNEADSTTGNGTWTASGDASGLTNDTLYYASGSGSLKFDLATAGSSGILTNSTLSSVDLTDYKDDGAIFFYVYLPDASDFTNVKIRWGSDASNYYEGTITTTHEGNSFEDGWNLLRINWSSATATGTPTDSAIDYLMVEFTYNGTSQTAVRLDNIVCRLGSIMEIVYYSKYLFRNASTGAFQETVLDDSDIVNLDTETYNILLYQIAIQASQQQAGIDSHNFDYKFFAEEYQKNINRYKALYKSQKTKPRTSYYKKPKSGYGGFTRVRFGN